MGDHTRRSITKDADDAVAIDDAPSKPMGQKTLLWAIQSTRAVVMKTKRPAV